MHALLSMGDGLVLAGTAHVGGFAYRALRTLFPRVYG